jgi:hypothetical protein
MYCVIAKILMCLKVSVYYYVTFMMKLYDCLLSVLKIQ